MSQGRVGSRRSELALPNASVILFYSHSYFTEPELYVSEYGQTPASDP